MATSKSGLVFPSILSKIRGTLFVMLSLQWGPTTLRQLLVPAWGGPEIFKLIRVRDGFYILRLSDELSKQSLKG